MIIRAVFTCGRREYLEATLASADQQISGPITRTVIFDDSGDPEFTDWLYTLGHSVASWGRNVGFTESMFLARRWLTRHTTESYVFHLEEDFTFDEPVDLTDLAGVLDGNDHLDQVALLRHPFFPRELRAGGIMEEHPEAYTIRSDAQGRKWAEHQLHFTCNPSLYRMSLADLDWPRKGRHTETTFGQQRVAAGQSFAYWDARPLCTHIGAEKKGHGW